MFESVEKICSGHQQLLSCFQVNLHFCVSFHLDRLWSFLSNKREFVYQSIQGTTLSSPDQPLQFSAREVLGQAGKLQQVDVFCHLLVLHHGACVDIDDLDSARLVGETNLNTDLNLFAFISKKESK